MAGQKLGLVRAFVIVWISSAVVGALLTSVFFRSPVGSTVVLGAFRHADRHPFTALAAFAVAKALVGAVLVCIGVRIIGFRVSYVVAGLALAFAAVITTAIAWGLASRTSGDPTGIATSAYALALLPLQILVNNLAPAYVIDGAASPTLGSAPPERPHYPPRRP